MARPDKAPEVSKAVESPLVQSVRSDAAPVALALSASLRHAHKGASHARRGALETVELALSELKTRAASVGAYLPADLLDRIRSL